MVREEAARNFGKFACTVEKLYWIDQFMLTFETSFTSDDEYQRQKCIGDRVQDKCLQACHMLSDQPEPCEAAGPDASRTDLVIAYVWLLGDDGNEIRSAAIDHLRLFCKILNPVYLFHYILNSIMVLFSPDPSQYELCGRVIRSLVYCSGRLFGIVPDLCPPEEQESAWDRMCESFILCWKERLILAEQSKSPITVEFTFYMSSVLLTLCSWSESLLGLISTKVVSKGLLEFLLRAEWSMIEDFIKTLHEFLWKLFEEPKFEIQFAKVFIHQYPFLMESALIDTEQVFSKYTVVSTFSAQVFGQPDLTQHLVREHGLLTMLLTFLGETLKSYNSENGAKVIRITCRLMDNVLEVVQFGGYVDGRNRFLGLWAKNIQFLCGLNPPRQDFMEFCTWWCVMYAWFTIEIRNCFLIG